MQPVMNSNDSRTVFNDVTVQSLIETGKQLAAPVAVQTTTGSKVPFIIVNGQVKMLPELVFNEHAERPERIKGNIGVYDAASFVHYFTLFSDPNSRVFADETSLKVRAVLDYHGAGSDGGPRWGDHKLTLTLRQSPEWQRWTACNNKQFPQQAFAEFLEQNGMDITKPDPAGIREIAEDLEATVDVDFGSAQKMAGGRVAFKYTETTKTTVSGGKQITVPDQFVVSIPPFVGGDRVPMQVLLRWRIIEQKLVFWYTLVRPEEVLRQAFLTARASIADKLKATIIDGPIQG